MKKRIWCAAHGKWHSEKAARICATQGREIKRYPADPVGLVPGPLELPPHRRLGGPD